MVSNTFPENIWQSLKRIISSRVVIAVLFVLIVAPLLFLARYDHPLSDDFYDVIWTDYWQSQWHWYMTWSGRYFSNIVATWTPVHWGSITGYRILIGLNILVVCGSILLTVRKLLAEFTGYDHAACWYIALFATWISVNNMPSLNEAFYWYTGAVTYAFSAALFCGLIWAIIYDHKHNDGHYSRKRLLVEVLLIFCIIGENESSMVMTDILCLYLYIMARVNKNAYLRRQYGILLCFAILFSAVSVFAPGNGVRSQLMHRNLIHALAMWGFFTKELILEWIYQPLFVIFTLAVFMLPNAATVAKPLKHYNVLAFFLFTIFIVYAMMLPGYYAVGSIPPKRTQNFIYLIFVGFWVYFIVMLKADIKERWKLGSDSLTYPREGIAVAAIIIIATLFTTKAVRTTNYAPLMMMIAKRVPQRYDAEIRQRYTLLSNAKGDSVGLPYIRSRAGNFLLFEDVYSIPNVWPNSAYEKYWKIKKVFINDTLMLPLY